MDHWIPETTRCSHCGKVAYENEDDAKYLAKSKQTVQVPYKCPYGNGWHLGTKK